jgi:uncharacterized membrane protein YphA (DoxX/SURF4 family)
MRLNIRIQNLFLESICLLYILLFVYAAVSKLLDFETFKVQLGQSPLLSAYADWIVYSIPIIEIVISVALLASRFRYIGLLAAFGLMVMFSVYIVIILNYSSFIPCSCGGILSEMNWTEHLTFNISFVVLALIAIVFYKKLESSNVKFIVPIVLVGAVSTIVVIALFLLSEEEIHRNNSFIRRYPHHPITTIKGIPINYNSYYIAGFAKGKIYLGNKTAPLHLLSIDTALKAQKSIRIKIADSKNYSFSAVQVRVTESKFYLSDGSVPIIYEGENANWTAKIVVKGATHFSQIEPTTNNSFVFRGNNKQSGEHILGTIDKSSKPEASYFPNALQKKIDGIFDTDGMLIYNEDLKKIIYTYYYRNSFIVADVDFKSIYQGKTIDTVSQVPMEFAYLKSNTEKKFAKQPPMIQKFATTAGKYLFVKSDRLGKYESENRIKEASIIDVYDLEKHTYEFSFYFYHYKNESVKEFKIYGNLIVGITKNYLVTATLKSKYFDLKNK